MLAVDVLSMSGGTITEDMAPLGQTELIIRQDIASVTTSQSSWTGGDIGGGMLVPFTILGLVRPAILNVGTPVAGFTPTFSGFGWVVGDGGFVHWLFGDINMSGRNREIQVRSTATFVVLV